MKWFPQILIGAIVFTLCLAFIGFSAFTRKLQTFNAMGLNARTQVVDRGPLIVKEIRSLSRLQTVSMTEQKVLEGRKEWGKLPDWLAGDRLVFVANGEVSAGVVLSTFGPEHLRWTGEEVRVRLPAPEVFHVRLDNRASFVVHRKDGLLNGADAQLETRVRQQADEVLLSGALKEGILDHARKNAEVKIGELLKTFGAKTVTFI